MANLLAYLFYLSFVIGTFSWNTIKIITSMNWTCSTWSDNRVKGKGCVGVRRRSLLFKGRAILQFANGCSESINDYMR
jgi:hypothetical protein